MEIVERVREIASGYLDEHGIELVEIIYRRESGGMVLRLLVDKESGIALSDCEALNNFLSERLDAEYVIDHRYTLEVSSPGLDRPLKTERDFERVLGRELDVDTYEPVVDKRHIAGKLIGIEPDAIEVVSSGARIRIPRAKIAVARIKITF